MKSAFLDAFSGLSGDMIVGAMLDAGADFDELRAALASLPLDGYRLAARRKLVSGISALKFEVEVTARQPERHLHEIREIVRRASALSAGVKDRAMAIFAALAEAEAKIHRTTPEEVHFHEVGAVDSIIDIVAAAWGYERLELGEMTVSPLPMGSGFVRSQHGVIPVPAPATAELLAGFPMRMGDGSSEMVTPTGAAIVRALATPVPPTMGFRRRAHRLWRRHQGFRGSAQRAAPDGRRARANLRERRSDRDRGQYRRPQSADLRPRDRTPARDRRARRDA